MSYRVVRRWMRLGVVMATVLLCWSAQAQNYDHFQHGFVGGRAGPEARPAPELVDDVALFLWGRVAGPFHFSIERDGTRGGSLSLQLQS